ncbi:hypothetical protein AMTRI_Chr10g3140 [Amborella trichopoda]
MTKDNLEESNKMRRGDVMWQYGTKVNDKRKVRCNFCGKEMGSVKGNVTGCKEVTAEVKQQILKLITKEKRKKVQREKDIKEIGRGYESPINEEDDQEVEFEAQIERARIASLQEHNYRQIEIHETYGRRDGASNSCQPQEHVVPGVLIEKVKKMISIFWYANVLPFNSANSDVYPPMVTSIVEAGPGVKGPTTKELAGSCLEAVVHDVDKHISQFKVCWPSTGVTIMTDGWKDKRVKTCILKSKLIARLIYNHMFLHALMREHYMREIVRESTTRFATTFLTIQSLLVHKIGLRATMSQLGRQVETTLLDRKFWAQCNNVVSVTKPLTHKGSYLIITYGLKRYWRSLIYFYVCLCQHNGGRYTKFEQSNCKRLQLEFYNLVYVHYNVKLRERHIRRTPTDYTDLVDEWVSLRIPLLDQDFLCGAVVDIDDYVDVAASNEGDMAMDMDDDYIQDENERKSRRRSYSTRERRSSSRHCNLIIHDDDNIEAVEGHNTEHGGGNTEEGGGEHESWTSLGDFG